MGRPQSLSMEELLEPVGKVYGKLTVLEYLGIANFGKYNSHAYEVQCSCSNKTIFIIDRHSLLSGHKRSCGCLLKETNSKLLTAMNTKYPFYDNAGEGPRFYKIWHGMLERCCSHDNSSYTNYGGRGIGVDWSWFMFENFFNDMHESYLKHVEEYGLYDTTIERIDVDDMYCKENCTWATRKEQMNNRRVTRYVEYQGGTYTCRDLIDKFPHHPDLDIDTLYGRLFGSNWDVDKALFVPPKRINR